MDANWQACLKAIRLEEGGNDDDPQDPGGRTSRGIIQREYDAYRRNKGLAKRDVWSASDEEIDDIYQISYWRPWCPQMPAGVDLVFFNMAVNAGAHEAALLLQRAVSVKDDGHIGIVTLSAVAHGSPRAIVRDFSLLCRNYYRSLRLFRRYGRGWMKRADTIETKALALVLP
jgi:lysozyme family protein